VIRGARARHVLRTVLFSLCALAVAVPGFTQSVDDTVTITDGAGASRLALRRIVSGLENPWSVAPLPGGGALITERPGRLLYLSSLEARAGTIVPVAGVPSVAAIRQGGLLDVIPSPGFPRDGLVYFSYAAPEGRGYVTRVGHGVLRRDGTDVRLAEVETIFSLNRPVGGGVHFGSRLVFDDEGYLYVTIGDRGEPEQAQRRESHQGSVVRIAPDGSIPPDNPRIGGAPGLFTWGHRNPQGIARNPADGAIWLHEHGPRGGDEINILRAGANYGWPEVTFGVAYSGRAIAESGTAPGFEAPLLHWTPSIAPSGMAFVASDRYPGWNGDLLVGALAGTHLRRVDLDRQGRVQGQELLFEGYARFRDVRLGPDGYVYVLTDARQGGLYRVEVLP
jgi:aldose sugar dehydrogenase